MKSEHTAAERSAEAAADAPTTKAGPPSEGAEESPEKLRAALSAKTQEIERLQDRVLRLQAEFENSKKRMAREKSEHLKFAHEGLILDFLPVLDNLERALAVARAEAGSSPLIEGIEMITRLFRSVLEKAGVKPMETVGQPFDPAYHQAVAQVDASPGEANLVVEEVQRGYLIESRVLRPAMVKVSRAVAHGSADGTGGGGA